MGVSVTYEFPRPALTVDCVVFGLDESDLKVMLVERGEAPFRGRWALPGGFVRIDESVDDAARRELREETGIRDVFLEQLYTFGDPGRDPRGPTVSVAYYALVNLSGHAIRATTDAANAAWFAATDLPRLAFDHDRILRVALDRLKSKVRYEPIGFELLPAKFTLSQLQGMYEKILERPLDKRNFRKKIESMDILIDTGELQQDVAHRAARLFRFDEERYRKLKKKGFNFEI